MIERFTRIIGSFLITAACYTAYAAVVVPWIEPSLPPIGPGVLTEDDLRRLEENAELHRAELAFWFGEHDWELDSPKIIETPQGKLLFDEYRPMDNGMVELKPCSMVFLSNDASGDAESRKRRALVLRAPDGALLRFDSAVNLAQAKIGKLIGGELLGEVQIVGGQRLPGPEDDLTITTRDVMLSETDISTPHLLEYRMGTHRGRGRGVAIELDNAEVAGKTELRGIKMLTLHEQVFVHLENHGEGDLFPGNAPGGSRDPAKPPTSGKNSLPIEIRCSGPFTFDLVQNVAVFRRGVDVSRRHPTGEADQITADMLKVFFVARESGAAAPAATEAKSNALNGAAQLSMKNLQPSRIEIVGEPAVVRAPTNNLQARAQFIEHDLASRAVKLRDADEAIVRQGEREIRTPELMFVPDADGTYGTFVAEGRGRLTGNSPDDPGQTFQAQWEKQLHFRKHEGQHVLTAEGAARVEATGKGSLAAEEIHLWLKEVVKTAVPQGAPPAQLVAEKPPTELIADRLLALGNVQIASPQVTGAVSRLEGWFEYAEAGPGMRQAFFRPESAALILASAAAEPLQFPRTDGPSASPNSGGLPSGRESLLRAVPLTVAAGSSPPAIASPSGGGLLPQAVPLSMEPLPATIPSPAFMLNPVAPVAGIPNSTAAPSDKQYRVEGELMRLLVNVFEKKMHVREVTIERNVKLTEIAVETPDVQPLLIQGDSLQLTQPSPQSSFVTVTGKPAYVEARGMTMSGGKLTLDRPNPQTNIVAVPGQGLMTLPVDRDLQGRPTDTREVLNLTWQGQLAFDGQTARFERGVEARLPNQYLRTDRLEVAFTHAVTFGQANQTQPDIRRVDCYDGVFLESRTVKLGALKSVDRLTSRTLSLDRPTGDIAAEGPGELTSVHRGSQGMPKAAGGGNPVAGAGVPAIPIGLGDAGKTAADAATINYLQTRFQRGMSGNETRREMNFFNQVRVLHGPVPDWNGTIDADRPENWSPETVLINCDQLQVTAVREAAADTDSYNMVAAGNTLVEGNAYTARAPRVTYAQSKDLLVIEGDGRTSAELYRQTRAGGQNSGTTAQRFMVWPSTKRVQVDGATFLDLTPN